MHDSLMWSSLRVAIFTCLSALNEIHSLPVVMNQRQFADIEFDFDVTGDAITGWLEIGKARYRLEDFNGAYIRFMDDRYLPELNNEPEDSPLRRHCRQLHKRVSM
jgi:hypothetical protein